MEAANVNQERRKYVRREADRELANQLRHLREQVGGDANREARHKLRRAIRHTCTVKINIQVGVKHGGASDWSLTDHPVAGRLLDLSADGCQLFTRDLLDIGAQMSLLITLQTGEDIRAVGVVRWNKSAPEKKGYAVGVQFTRADHDAKARIQAFLEHLDRTGGL